ncbi:ribonuclease H-like domain-containing protein [Tanacetum coccineum]
MEFKTAQNTTTAKLPILKLCEYEMWVIRIKQYFQVQDYDLWEVIENRNSWVSVPSVYRCQTLFAAIETRFGGNEATKKTQKALLKHQYENFNASSSESLDSIFNKLQKIDSRLAILGVMDKADIKTLSIDDLYNNFKIVEQDVKKYVNANNGSQNLVFMSAQRTSSTNDVNTANPDVSTVSTNAKTASTTDDTATLSDATVYDFLANQPKGSQLVHEDLEQIHDDDLEEMDLKWQLALLSMRAKRFYQRTGKKITISRSDTAGFDKSKVECFNYHKMGHFARECRNPKNQDSRGRNHDTWNRNQDSTRKPIKVEDTSSKAMMAINGVGFDWSDMAEEQVQTNMALMALSDSKVYTEKSCSKTCLKNHESLKKQCDDLIVKLNDSDFKTATYKRGLATLEDQLVTYKKNEVLFCEEIVVLKREVGCKEYELGVLRTELEKVKQEKEGIDFKIAKFDKSTKDLDELLESQRSDKNKQGLGYHVVAPPHPLTYNRPTKLDLYYSGLDEFKEPEFNGYGPRDTVLESTKDCSKESDNSNTDDSVETEQVSEDTSSSSDDTCSLVESPLKPDRETVIDWHNTGVHTDKKKEFVKPKTNEKPVKKKVRYAEMYRSQYPRGNQRNRNGQKSNQLGSDFVMNNKACFSCGSFNHLQINCPNHQKKRIVFGNNYNRVDYDYYAKTTHPRTHKNMTPRAVLLRTGQKPLSTAKPVYTAHPKPIVHCARPKTHFYKQAQSTVQRPFYKKPTLTNRHFNHKVNTDRPRIVHTARSYRAPVNTIRPRVFNTARPFTGQVNTVKAYGANVVKPSACWVWRPTRPNGASLGNPQMNDKGFVDSGCSRHMTGGAYGGRISGKGTLKTDSLDFDDVYFVKELNFNLFSVLQMCDKKNYVLFTDSECLVLSPEFKLPDKSQILLRIPREDNMYSFDMKNIVPKDSLTCLAAKATLDELML